MAYFTATNPGALDSSTFNLPADLQAAQQIQQGRNALSLQGQQVADQQQEVGLRPGLAAHDPQALNALSAIDPSLAGQYQTNWANQAQLPLLALQRTSQAMAAAAQGVVAAAPGDRPAAYRQMLATVRPYGLGAGLPDDYPGDGALQQIALFGADPGKILDYLNNRVTVGGAPAVATGTNTLSPPGAQSTPSGVNPATVGLQGPQGPNSTAGLGDGTAPTPDQLAVLNTPLPPNAGDGAPQATPTDVAAMPTPPGGSAPSGGQAPSQQTPAVGPGSPPPPAPLTTSAPPLPSGSTAADSGFRPLMKGGRPVTTPDGAYIQGVNSDGSPAAQPVPHGPADPSVLAVNAHITDAAKNGFQFVKGADGIGRYVVIPGGPADPTTKHGLAVAGDTSGPNATSGAPGGAPTAPGQPATGVAPAPQQVGVVPSPQTSPLPLPPVDPYAGLANNAALAKRMNDDKEAAAKAVSDSAPIVQKDQTQIQNAQQFMDLNARTPTGPYAGGEAATFARAALPFTPSNAPYQAMDKVANEMKISGLPVGLGRLDLPIIQAVAKSQPSVTNLREVNTNIANVQIARANRDMMYRQAQAQWVQHNGTLAGFDQLWSDYNNNVPALTMTNTGQAGVNTAAPPFQQWAWRRADPQTGRYDPRLASVPDTQLSGSPPPPSQAPQQQAAPLPQTRQASAQPQPTGLAALEGHVVQQNGHSYMIRNGQPVLVQ